MSGGTFYYIWPTAQIRSFGSVIWSRIVGRPVFIYSVFQFRSNEPDLRLNLDIFLRLT